MVLEELRETIKNQGQFEFIFATVVAIMLLIVWIAASIWMIILSVSDDCVISGGSQDEFCPTSGAVDVHNVLFGVISAMVLVELAVTPRGRDPSDRLVTKIYKKFPTDTCLRRCVLWTPAAFLLSWVVIGLLTLIFGVVASDKGGALRTTGFAWLGFAGSAFFSYFGQKGDDPEQHLQETYAATRSSMISMGGGGGAIPLSQMDPMSSRRSGLGSSSLHQQQQQQPPLRSSRRVDLDDDEDEEEE